MTHTGAPSPKVLGNQEILDALNRYVMSGLIEYVITSDPVGQHWTIGVGGERLALYGNAEPTVWLAGVSAALDWAHAYLVQADLAGNRNATPGEKAAAMADRAHEAHRAHASSRPVDGCVWCEAEERDRRG